MVEYWEKVQRTSAGPYVDLVPGKKQDWQVPYACLTRADM